MTRRQPAAALLAWLALVGCQDPYTEGGTTAGDSPRPYEHTQAERPRGDELPPPAPSTGAVPTVNEAAARRSARTVLEAFCSQWANWSWRTIQRQHRRLASVATGRLRRQLAAEAALRGQDQTLRRGRLGVRGRVVAIDVKRGARTREAVCVAWEEPLANGHVDLEGGRYRVYLATVARTDTGWVVRRWEPQL